MKAFANGILNLLQKRNLLIFATLTMLGLAMCCFNAIAQSGAGYIQGTVTDPSGAIIPGATIHVVNQATGVAANTTSNSAGYYQVPDLFAATYEIQITAPGMKTYVRTLQLLVDQHAVVNAKMVVGAVSEQVTVTGNVVQMVDVDNGTVESTLDQKRISQTPMNGRQLLQLAALTTPGFDGTPQESNNNNGMRANGLMAEALEYVADGVPMTNRNFGGEVNSGQATLPDPDSVDQVQFEMIDTPAQYATPGTAIITTKSGTNHIHGSLFETAVNNFFGVAKQRQNLSNFAAPQYIRNEFGASAGGPLRIPHIYNGVDKTFWFFAYERYSLASVTREQVSVPDTQMENGDFSELLQLSAASSVQLFDPASTALNGGTCTNTTTNPANNKNTYCRTPFPNNQIPVGRMSPLAKQLYAISPKPNIAGANPFAGPNLNAPNDSYVVVPTITWRLDQHFNEANKAYLRFTYNNQLNRALRNYPNNSAGTIASDGFPDGASGYQVIPITNIGAGLGYTHIFSPTFFAETVLAQQWFYQYVGGGGNPNLNYEKMFSLPNNFGETGFPVITGLSTMDYGGTQYNYQENQIISQIDENLTKILGKHQLQFGGRIRHERLYYLNDRSADSTTFGSGQTTDLYEPSSSADPNGGSAFPKTGNGDADLFLGGAYKYSVSLQPPPSHFADIEYDGYFQDNWHASQWLTLNLGLRYEAHPGKSIRDNLATTFDLANDAVVLGGPIQTLINQGYTTQAIITNMQNIGVKFETPQQAGLPSNLYYSANVNFSPRVGFAWQPFGVHEGTVIRGGYGRYIYPIPTRNSNPGPKALPFTYGYTQDYTSAPQSPDGHPNYNLREVYNPATNPNAIVAGYNSGNNIVNSSTITAITPGISATYYAPDYKPDQVSEINITAEHPLKWDSAIRISWVRTHGSYLDHAYYPNQPFSKFVWQVDTGTDPPTGTTIGLPTYQATALGPYDNLTYGNFVYDVKTGWSTDNALQANWQRLSRHGFGYQIFYVYSRGFRIGGNSTRDSQTYNPVTYLGYLPAANGVTVSSPYPITPAAVPPARPSGLASYADWKGLDRWERWQMDGTVTPHHFGFSGIVDLPFGRGKRYLGTTKKWVDELVGGYQISGVGYVLSSIFQPGSSNWGPTSPIKIYKHKYKVSDCRSGNCYPAYFWFNGYIPSSQNGNLGCTGKCVFGLPTDYTPYEQPIDVNPADGANYNTNNVTISGPGLKAGGETTTYGSGAVGTNRYSKTFINGPFNWEADISLFKVFPITETVNFRANVDVFNFLNHQGFNNPNTTDGVQAFYAGGQSGATSFNPPRQVQLSLRLTF